MISLQCSGIQRLHSLRCTMVAVFLWIQGAVCLNFASTNGVRQEREKVLTLDLPGHHSHSSLHLCPSYFPTTLHLLPPGPPQATFTVLWEPLPLFSPSLSLTRIYHQFRFKVTGRHRIPCPPNCVLKL